jgi:hypothetical protein
MTRLIIFAMIVFAMIAYLLILGGMYFGLFVPMTWMDFMILLVILGCFLAFALGFAAGVLSCVLADRARKTQFIHYDDPSVRR